MRLIRINVVRMYSDDICATFALRFERRLKRQTYKIIRLATEPRKFETGIRGRAALASPGICKRRRDAISSMACLRTEGTGSCKRSVRVNRSAANQCNVFRPSASSQWSPRRRQQLKLVCWPPCCLTNDASMRPENGKV